MRSRCNDAFFYDDCFCGYSRCQSRLRPNLMERKLMNRILIASAFLLMVVYLTGCDNNGVLTNTGDFALGKSGHMLKIQVDNGIVLASVVDETGASQLDIDEEASAYSRWSFYWENDHSTLWFCSSDVGLFFYSRSPSSSQYTRHVVTDTGETFVPLAFLEAIPNSMKDGLVGRGKP